MTEAINIFGVTFFVVTVVLVLIVRYEPSAADWLATRLHWRATAYRQHRHLIAIARREYRRTMQEFEREESELHAVVVEIPAARAVRR